LFWLRDVLIVVEGGVLAFTRGVAADLGVLITYKTYKIKALETIV
jgi:hypothetical protein